LPLPPPLPLPLPLSPGDTTTAADEDEDEGEGAVVTSTVLLGELIAVAGGVARCLLLVPPVCGDLPDEELYDTL
jgi:hypothetical protein